MANPEPFDDVFHSPDVYRSLLDIVWHFGPQGMNGECCADLSMPEFRALEKAAGTQNCPVAAIGEFLGFTKSGATRIIKRLEKKGYVRKVKSQEDARVCCVMLTKSGEKVLNTTANKYARGMHLLFSRIPRGESTQVQESLIALAKIIRK